VGGDAHAFYDKLQAVLIAAGFDALGRHRPGRRTIAILERRAEHGLIKGERIGVDASTKEPTRRCARSFGATAAKAIAIC
jgi:hypothetical protein